MKNVMALTTSTTVFILCRFMSYFSSWTKLKQFTAWLTRFKRYLYERAIGSVPLAINELDNSKKDLSEYVQRQEFMGVCNWTKRHKPSDNINSMNFVINISRPIVVDNFIRVGGCLNSKDLPMKQERSITLLSKHPIIELIIRYYHQAEGHMEVYHTLVISRKMY